MARFSWKAWLGVFARVPLSKKAPRPRRRTLAAIEGLEDRALLTANLPVAVNDTYVMDANTSLNGQSVLTNDFDADGDDITQAILSATTSNGSLSLTIDGTFTYTPTNGFVGTDSFTYIARDGINGESSTNAAIVTIHVGTENAAPVALDASFTTAVDTVLNGTVSGTDANNDPLTFTGGAITTSHGFVTLFANGNFTYTPDAGYNGPDSFTFKANDGIVDGPEATVSITVGSTDNTAPVAENQSVSTLVDTVLNGTLTGTDADDDTLSFAAGAVAPAHGDATVNTDGTFSYTPDAGFTGNDSFSFIVNDGTVDSEEATVSITVNTVGNTVPVATSAAFVTPTSTALNETLTASDADGDPLTFTLGSLSPIHGTLTLNPNGTFTYTPNAGYNGNDGFKFKVNDGIVDSAEASISITVGGIINNIPPVANFQTVHTTINTQLNGTLTGSDADGDSLTFTIGDFTPIHGSVVVNPNGTFTYTPNLNFIGTDSFTFKANDGIDDSDEATVTVNVGTTGNTVPVANSETFVAVGNSPFSGTLTGSDADGDTLSFSLGTSQPTHGTVTLAASGAFTYTPGASFTGTDSFTFRVNDGSVSSFDATVTIRAGSASNTSPTVQPVTITTNTNTAFSGTLTATDVDGDTITFSAGEIVPSHGTVTIDSDGSFVYTPTAGFTGSDSFSFKANDGTANSTDATVTVLVGLSNSGPIGVPEIITTNVNTPFNGSLTGLDPEGDPLTFAIGSVPPQNGTVTINPDGTFVYTPNTDFEGDDLFSFKVNDGISDSSDAIVGIHVGTPGNTPPEGEPQTVSTNMNTSVNGILTATDAEDDPLTFAAGSVDPLHGTVVVNSNGTFTYSPNMGFVGDDLFSFTASDGTNVSSEAIVIIRVAAAGNTGPTVISGSGNVIAGVGFNGSLAPLAIDLNGDSLTFTAVTQPNNGTLSLSPDGNFVYTANAGFSGTDSFTFQANDGSLDSSIATFNLNVGTDGDGFTLNLSATPGTIATSKQAVTPLDPTATLVNVDPALDFGNARLTANIVSGADSHDKLVVTDGSGGGGSVDVRGKKIFFNGSLVGRISGGRRNRPLQVTFESNATVDAVNGVLQRIGVRTTKSASGGTRTIQMQVSAGGSTSTATIDANLI